MAPLEAAVQAARREYGTILKRRDHLRKLADDPNPRIREAVQRELRDRAREHDEARQAQHAAMVERNRVERQLVRARRSGEEGCAGCP